MQARTLAQSSGRFFDPDQADHADQPQKPPKGRDPDPVTGSQLLLFLRQVLPGDLNAVDFDKVVAGLGEIADQISLGVILHSDDRGEVEVFPGPDRLSVDLLQFVNGILAARPAGLIETAQDRPELGMALLVECAGLAPLDIAAP